MNQEYDYLVSFVEALSQSLKCLQKICFVMFGQFLFFLFFLGGGGVYPTFLSRGGCGGGSISVQS